MPPRRNNAAAAAASAQAPAPAPATQNPSPEVVLVVQNFLQEETSLLHGLTSEATRLIHTRNDAEKELQKTGCISDETRSRLVNTLKAMLLPFYVRNSFFFLFSTSEPFFSSGLF